MESILEGRSNLKSEIEKTAEVAGYLWQNGWAERNGGNITVNITDLIDDEVRAMPAISEVKQIGITLPYLSRAVISIARVRASVCAISLASLWRMVRLSVYLTIAQVM